MNRIELRRLAEERRDWVAERVRARIAEGDDTVPAVWEMMHDLALKCIEHLDAPPVAVDGEALTKLSAMACAAEDIGRRLRSLAGGNGWHHEAVEPIAAASYPLGFDAGPVADSEINAAHSAAAAQANGLDGKIVVTVAPGKPAVVSFAPDAPWRMEPTTTAPQPPETDPAEAAEEPAAVAPGVGGERVAVAEMGANIMVGDTIVHATSGHRVLVTKEKGSLTCRYVDVNGAQVGGRTWLLKPSDYSHGGVWTILRPTASTSETDVTQEPFPISQPPIALKHAMVLKYMLQPEKLIGIIERESGFAMAEVKLEAGRYLVVGQSTPWAGAMAMRHMYEEVPGALVTFAPPQTSTVPKVRDWAPTDEELLASLAKLGVVNIGAARALLTAFQSECGDADAAKPGIIFAAFAKKRMHPAT